MPRVAVSLLSLLVVALAACGADGAGDPAGEDVEIVEPEEAPDDAAEDDGDDDGADVEAEQDDAGPEPDPARLEDPCAEHEGREGEAFLDVVAPVDGQRVEGEVRLVGCASVPEGTVRYRLLDAGGETLADDFTTATYGGPELGEFDETVGVDATGEATLEVFWDSPAEGEGERDLVEIDLVLD